MTIIRKIGFIGVGNMGNPMAANLLKGGFDITVFDARPETAAAFVARQGGGISGRGRARCRRNRDHAAR
jgi:3-hydroxyisobutyrate dehydrogenase